MRGVWPWFSYSPSMSIKEHLFYEFHNVDKAPYQILRLSHYGCHSFLFAMPNKRSPLSNINDDNYITTPLIKSKRIVSKSNGFSFECESNTGISFKGMIYEDGAKKEEKEKKEKERTE